MREQSEGPRMGPASHLPCPPWKAHGALRVPPPTPQGSASIYLWHPAVGSGLGVREGRAGRGQTPGPPPSRGLR